METEADLRKLAMELNPVVGFYDPLGLGVSDAGLVVPWTEEQRIGFLRQAEIKHARVAMAAFVGYCVQSNGIFFPWVNYDDVAALSPPEQWDALSTDQKVVLFLTIFFLEWIGEANGQKSQGSPWDFQKWRLQSEEESKSVQGLHWMTGGKPGVHPVWRLNVLAADLTPEQKAVKLRAEINNGRLAMLGIMSLVAEAKVPGSVLALDGKLKPYSGEVMAPFTANDVSLPFVSKMLEVDPIGQLSR
jgi:hypothetical protein